MLENIYFLSSRCFCEFLVDIYKVEGASHCYSIFFLWKSSLMVGTTTFLAVPLFLRHIELV